MDYIGDIMNDRINILGYPVDNLTTDEILDKMKETIAANKKMQIVPINANKLYQVRENKVLADILKSAEMVIPEYAIVWGSRIIGSPLVEHVGGVMLMRSMLENTVKNDYKFYFLGAREDIVKAMVEKLEQDYKGIRIAGWHDGYFEDEKKMVQKINESGANILLAALGTPKQEYFLNRYKSALKPCVMMGVGGSFDVFAGLRQETPSYLRHGFEWLYRLFQDPRNLWKRYMTTNPYFVYRVFRYRLFSY